MIDSPGPLKLDGLTRKMEKTRGRAVIGDIGCLRPDPRRPMKIRGASFVPDIPERPADLPDFESPPLNEVVLGVQFNPPIGYQQINAGEVWALFRSEFSKVEERAALAPAFETFGLSAKGLRLGLMSGPSHDRFWFERPDGTELIQFQQDRLLHNWKKVGDRANEYPRFEGMMKRFCAELEELEQYFNRLSSQSTRINQCELTYVNHIPFEVTDQRKASDWLRFVDFAEHEPEDFSLSFREIIHDEEGKPQGRLTCEFAIAFKPSGGRIILMTLTARGVPKEPTKESAFEFLVMGRTLIVSRFADLTTEAAHREWGRIR